MPIEPYKAINPLIGYRVYVAPNSYVIGDVHVGDDCSIWYGVSIRGDVNYIRIGKRTNIQDNSVVHVTRETGPTFIGDDVTIGHGVIIHACSIGNRCLIGMGAIILDGVEISDNVLIGAGALVPPNTKIPRNTLFVGSPGKVKRDLTEEEIAFFQISAENYLKLKDEYLL